MKSPYIVTVSVPWSLRWRVRAGLLVMRVGAWLAMVGYRVHWRED